MESVAYGFFFDIGKIIVSAAVMAYIARVLKQPPMLGYVLAGLLLGSFGLGAIQPTAEMRALSELGIAFLLFGAAVEVNLLKLRGIGVQSVLAALVQVPATAILGAALFYAFGLSAEQALLFGAVAAFSSTMVAMKVLQDTHKTYTLHARLEVALLILQDLLAILVLAYFSSAYSGTGGSAFANAAAGGMGLFCIAIVLNRFAFPPMLKAIARSPEVLFISSVAICFSFMWLSQLLGLSIAVGAFVAGISLSTFPYNLEVSGKMRSLRDFFAAIFFVTLGTQLGTVMGAGDVQAAVLLAAFVLAGKFAITSIIYALLGFGFRISVLAAAGISQISEFSFILAVMGLQAGVLSPGLFSAITAATIATIILTPYIVKNEYAIYEFLWRAAKPFRALPIFSIRAPSGVFEESRLSGHTVILGAHRMGRVLVEDLKGEKILVVDYNPAVMDELLEEGVKCVYADAYSDETLSRLSLETAKALISTLPDPDVVLAVTRKAKEINPHIKVYAKADFAEDARMLYEAGADLVVIPDLLAGESFSFQVKDMMHNPSRLQEIRRRHLAITGKQSSFDNHIKKFH